jgi:colicin import membrane protein
MSSDYERDIAKMLVENNEELEELKKNPERNSLRIRSVMGEIEALQALFENYNLGMNYFRRARGGRAGLRE